MLTAGQPCLCRDDSFRPADGRLLPGGRPGADAPAQAGKTTRLAGRTAPAGAAPGRSCPDGPRQGRAAGLAPLLASGTALRHAHGRRAHHSRRIAGGSHDAGSVAVRLTGRLRSPAAPTFTTHPAQNPPCPTPGLPGRTVCSPMHVHDVHAVKTSMAVRSGGPVLARWLLKPAHIASPASSPMPVPVPACATHWTTWWGVFLPEPGHHNGALRTDRRLVAYVKLTRCADVVHYLDIMGHKDHLPHGVMPFMHAAIVNWLLDAAEPCAAGVRAVWYGALEHGG